jgi:hypothetical protein
MSKKAKSGGCKKKIRSPKTSKGLRRNIAKSFGKVDLLLRNAQRYQ